MRYPVTVDGHFMTKPVDEHYQNHELLKIPFMTGINNHEGGWILPMVRTNVTLSLISLHYNSFNGLFSVH